MDRPEVRARLREFLQTEFANESVDLLDTTDLLEEWFVDSLGIVQTVMFIEREFNITVSRADINGQNFKSVATLASFVSARLE